MEYFVTYTDKAGLLHTQKVRATSKQDARHVTRYNYVDVYEIKEVIEKLKYCIDCNEYEYCEKDPYADGEICENFK